ncbi:CdaR family protein [Pigmentibacter ruber]|uniref:CdaR family protein n=1 Tax=Pigmentibacter ruber TaxID=2683196 RepID=UPI00131E919D|nr:CdaR family protein [Pigmentibacter ruber]
MPVGPQQENLSIARELFKLITNNFWLKVLSFLFSIVIFFIVRTDKDLTFEKVARVKLVTSPSMIILGQKERTLDVTIKQQNSIFSISPTDIELTGEIEIISETPGKVRVKVGRENFPRLPKQYNMIIERPYIDVDIDKIQEKILPIQAVLKGEPQPGLMVEQVKVTPSQIKVSGARQQLARTQNIFTIPIVIEGINKNLITDANIELEESSAIKSIEKSVVVAITLGPKKFNRTFRSVPIEIKNIAKRNFSKIQLRPSSVDVEVSGQRIILNKLDPSDVRVFIDATDLKPGWQDKPIILKIPGNVSLVKIIPDFISVHLNP